MISHVYEAVTMPRLMLMTSTVSEESLARDRHTYSSMYTVSKVLDLVNK